MDSLSGLLQVTESQREELTSLRAEMAEMEADYENLTQYEIEEGGDPTNDTGDETTTSPSSPSSESPSDRMVSPPRIVSCQTPFEHQCLAVVDVPGLGRREYLAYHFLHMDDRRTKNYHVLHFRNWKKLCGYEFGNGRSSLRLELKPEDIEDEGH
tara:strand:+ start:1668 stop:2132 length:465 start_codon:yes stop_codon:yes gene_type:complete